MPIRPENRARYPANWRTEIRPAILARAGNRCEGSPAYPDCRVVNGEVHPVTGSRVVLTVAHLDHTPENCAPGNLRAWCQRCHITYDAPMKAAKRRKGAADHVAALLNAAQDLLAESEEYEFDDGLGRGAPQQYWDALQDALERGGDE